MKKMEPVAGQKEGKEDAIRKMAEKNAESDKYKLSTDNPKKTPEHKKDIKEPEVKSPPVKEPSTEKKKNINDPVKELESKKGRGNSVPFGRDQNDESIAKDDEGNPVI